MSCNNRGGSKLNVLKIVPNKNPPVLIAIDYDSRFLVENYWGGVLAHLIQLPLAKLRVEYPEGVDRVGRGFDHISDQIIKEIAVFLRDLNQIVILVGRSNNQYFIVKAEINADWKLILENLEFRGALEILSLLSVEYIE